MIRCCGTGFNRYIVECKSEGNAPDEKIFEGFNRYIVECKLKMDSCGLSPFIDLIDT